MSVASNDCTVVDATSPLMEEVTRFAALLHEAGVIVSMKLHQPGETGADHEMQALSHALQSSIRAAINKGMPHGDVFRSLAVAVGWAARTQTLTIDRASYLTSLGNKALPAAQMGDEAARIGFPTMGEA